VNQVIQGLVGIVDFQGLVDKMVHRAFQESQDGQALVGILVQVFQATQVIQAIVALVQVVIVAYQAIVDIQVQLVQVGQ
jgi:uncharacterized membrane protein